MSQPGLSQYILDTSWPVLWNVCRKSEAGTVRSLQILASSCLFALLSLHTQQCFHQLPNSQTVKQSFVHFASCFALDSAFAYFALFDSFRSTRLTRLLRLFRLFLGVPGRSPQISDFSAAQSSPKQINTNLPLSRGSLTFCGCQSSSSLLLTCCGRKRKLKARCSPNHSITLSMIYLTNTSIWILLPPIAKTPCSRVTLISSSRWTLYRAIVAISPPLSPL